MPDQNPSIPGPTPTPAPNPRAPRSQLNQSQLADLGKAEEVALMAQKPDAAAALDAREIKADMVATLLSDVDIARRTGGEAVAHSTRHGAITGDEATLMENLQAAIREVQKMAKTKYQASDATQLANYFVGERLDSRTRLTAIAAAIIARLDGPTPQDTLPGISAEKIGKLKDAAAVYTNINIDQAQAQSDASRDRGTLNDQVDSINQRRRAIQLAADAEWPHTDASNAPMRIKFKLPPNRPLS